MRRRVAVLCPLDHGTKRPHGERPQVEVTVVACDNEPGVAGAWRCVLQYAILGDHPVRLVQ